MTDVLSLIKANPLLHAEDFAWLRKQGIKHIEETGSSIWTDYNTSDPGITMLEAVCYAITDLAYRTGFEVSGPAGTGTSFKGYMETGILYSKANIT